MCYQYLGLSPSETDELTWREVYVMLRGGRERELSKWEHTLALVTAVYNWGGPRGKQFRPKPLDFFFKRMRDGGSKLPMPVDELKKYLRRMREDHARAKHEAQRNG